MVVPSRIAAILFRIVALVLLVWAAVNAGRDAGLATERHLARRVMEGYRLEPALVRGAADSVKARALGPCDGDVSRIASLLHARATEGALFAPDTADIGAVLEDYEAVLRRRLACEPGDGFAWYGMFWTRLASGRGAEPVTAEFLRMSYRAAPLEMWIARLRNPVAASLGATLPSDLRTLVAQETVDLLKVRQYDVVARVLPGLSPEQMAAVEPALRQLDPRTVLYFQQFVSLAGLPAVNLPGVPPLDGRPRWMR